jgi:hypothetical protein
MARISLGVLLDNHVDGTRMRLFPQLHERNWNAQGHTTFAQQRRRRRGCVYADGTRFGFWHGFIGVLGRGDADNDLRIHFSSDGEYHGRGHYEFWQRPGLRALGRSKLERHDFRDYAIAIQQQVAAMGRKLEMRLQVGEPLHHQ